MLSWWHLKRPTIFNTFSIQNISPASNSFSEIYFILSYLYFYLYQDFFFQSFKVSFYRQTGTIQILCLDMLILFSIDFWLHWLHWLHLKCTGFFKIKTGYFIKFEKRKTTSFLWVRRTVVYVILTHFFKANIVRNC